MLGAMDMRKLKNRRQLPARAEVVTDLLREDDQRGDDEIRYRRTDPFSTRLSSLSLVKLGLS